MKTMKYYLPSEWHEQHAVQLTWPHKDTDWAPYLDDIVEMEVQIARNVADYEDVIIAAQNAAEVRELLETRLTPAQMERVSIYEMPTNDTWARDHGAITLFSQAVNAAGDECNAAANDSSAAAKAENSAKLLDFCFNGWGEKFRAEKDNMITSSLLKQGAFDRYYAVEKAPKVGCCCCGGAEVEVEDNLDFVLEGGSIESDGKGTVFTTSMCLLAPHRNQPMDRAQIEEELKRRLGAERVVWIDYGSLVGDDTDGHIDTTVRIAPEDTLLYVKCYDEDDEQFADFDAMEKQLQAFRTVDGKPYRLLPLPMPRAIYDDGDRLPATYANFLIINGAVLVPTYNQPDLDAQALETIALAFPGRKIIGIDARVAVRQHGSLHCLTMQFPFVGDFLSEKCLLLK